MRGGHGRARWPPRARSGADLSLRRGGRFAALSAGRRVDLRADRIARHRRRRDAPRVRAGRGGGARPGGDGHGVQDRAVPAAFLVAGRALGRAVGGQPGPLGAGGQGVDLHPDAAVVRTVPDRTGDPAAAGARLPRLRRRGVGRDHGVPADPSQARGRLLDGRAGRLLLPGLRAARTGQRHGRRGVDRCDRAAALARHRQGRDVLRRRQPRRRLRQRPHRRHGRRGHPDAAERRGVRRGGRQHRRAAADVRIHRQMAVAPGGVRHRAMVVGDRADPRRAVDLRLYRPGGRRDVQSR